MGLSNDLISQFVKITKDKPSTKKETVVYGTIDKKDTSKVKIDGSDISTPVTKTVLADTHQVTKDGEPVFDEQGEPVMEGDRVIVTIKNHSAIVTGNISNPSAKGVDLEVETARIDNLVTVNADVQGTLTAQQADIKDIKAEYVTTENLTTNYLTAGTIRSEYILGETVTADFLKVNNELTAVKGDIRTLNSEVANIDTLIFGSATGDVIQTSFSNAVIAQLGDAQIKSAMIESVSAGKITAGDIITNNVRVKSEDGSLIISDETLQISDDNRVRVQIGKDASNDYSINVWDQNGNLMFSKGGITDAAIKEAIIRNDMVSDTANIHASKLDIDSLFEEVNSDNSNTIKSTKVYLDEEGQTLDVAFKSLTTEVTDQGEIISSQGTAISTIQGQISSKIWQQDINTAKNEMSTQYSTLEQEVDSFKTTVGETYATVTDTTNLNARITTVEQTAEDLSIELTNLEIGGRNLLRDSKLVPIYSNNNTKYPISCTIMTENDISFYRVKRRNIETYPSTSLSMNATISKDSFVYTEMIGKQVVLSFRARASHEVSGTFLCRTYGSGTMVDFTKPEETFTNEWKTYYITIDDFPDLTDNDGIMWNPYVLQLTEEILSDFYLDIRDYKFELGNKATDWTPAPEDVESNILDASKTATNYLNFSSNGLVIGDLTTSALGKNVLIDSESVKIRTGNTENAVFGADIIELAKDNESATISMLNGAFKIYYNADNSDGGFGIYGVTSDGKERLAFQPVNENDNLTIGWGGYNAKANCTNIYGHNMNLIAGNDMAIECEDWKINIDGNLFAKASNNSFIELIGLSSDDNTAIGHGGYTSSLGKTNIYGNKINHIVNTTRGSATYKPYYEAGDSVEIEWYGAGFISSSSKVVYFTIPLAKPIIGGTTPNVSVSSHSTDGGLRIRQDGNYVFGSASDTHIAPSSYKAQVSGDGNMVRIEATMGNNTNASNNAPCGVDARIKLTFS